MKLIRRLLFKFFPNKMYSREITKLERFYNPKISKAKGLDRSNLIDKMNSETYEIHIEWELEKSQKLLKKTRCYDFVIPQEPIFPNESEFYCLTNMGYILSNTAKKQLKKELRAEKEYRRNNWAFYVGSLTGVLGLVVSIIALLKK